MLFKVRNEEEMDHVLMISLGKLGGHTPGQNLSSVFSQTDFYLFFLPHLKITEDINSHIRLSDLWCALWRCKVSLQQHNLSALKSLTSHSPKEAGNENRKWLRVISFWWQQM